MYCYFPPSSSCTFACICLEYLYFWGSALRFGTVSCKTRFEFMIQYLNIISCKIVSCKRSPLENKIKILIGPIDTSAHPGQLLVCTAPPTDTPILSCSPVCLLQGTAGPWPRPLTRPSCPDQLSVSHRVQSAPDTPPSDTPILS
jgi:hypothetical protein